MSNLEQLNNEFRHLFDGDNEDEDNEGELPRRKRYSPVEEFTKSWSWFVMVDNLAGGDQTKWDIIFEWKVKRFLNGLSFAMDKNKMLEQQARKQQMNG